MQHLSCDYEHGMQDVAVKVLTEQDFNDDQLKEFLREVSMWNLINAFEVVREGRGKDILYEHGMLPQTHYNLTLEYIMRIYRSPCEGGRIYHMNTACSLKCNISSTSNTIYEDISFTMKYTK